MYDNPRHRKDNVIKARLDDYEVKEFYELAAKLRLQPGPLAGRLLREFIEEAKQQSMQSDDSFKAQA